MKNIAASLAWPRAMVVALTLGATTVLTAQAQDLSDWKAVQNAARGQTVYFHAWGGDPKINAFISWLGDRSFAQDEVKIEHVKLDSTTTAVAQVRTEVAAGRASDGGSVDLIWINGENFTTMRSANLLYGPFAEALPNWALVDVVGKPATTMDFTTPTDGYESPWALAQLVFEYDSKGLQTPPQTFGGLAGWLEKNPGRFTYPQPPDYLGLTFLKQAAYELVADPKVLLSPVDDATYEQIAAPLWEWISKVHPNLWRKGEAFPRNEAHLGQLLADGEIDLSFSFNPNRASAEIAAGNLSDTIRTYVPAGGTIGNASFVAIPVNASNKPAALVIANLILDPEVQARAQNPDILGFQTVLDVTNLSEVDRQRFAALPRGKASLSPQEMGKALLEPHASWMERLTRDWEARYLTR